VKEFALADRRETEAVEDAQNERLDRDRDVCTKGRVASEEIEKERDEGLSLDDVEELEIARMVLEEGEKGFEDLFDRNDRGRAKEETDELWYGLKDGINKFWLEKDLE